MKTPDFWLRRTRLSMALLPLSLVYVVAYHLRRAFTVQRRLGVPVVCVGNVTAGGSGKTPVALHIGAMLKEKGVNAFYVSRGYGGTAQGPVLVKLDKHRSFEVGDEPLMLAQVLPTVVGKDRIKAAEYAIKKGAKLLIFDDGFQNKKFYKDFSFLVLDGAVGLGNGLLLPAGPLRETLASALKRAHCVVTINKQPHSPAIPKDRQQLAARTQVVGLGERLQGQKVVGFCGIAFPDKFRQTLIALGARVVSFTGFGDHAHYRHETLLPLAETASKEQAYLVTTRKDFVRLPRGFRDKVVVVDIALSFDDPQLLSAQVDYIAGLV